MTELLDMGKYAGFIWASYGVSIVVILGLMVRILGQRKAAKVQLRALEDKAESANSQ